MADLTSLGASELAEPVQTRSDDLRPLHGVPFTAKENIGVGGTPTTQGAKAAANSHRLLTCRS